MKPYLSLFLISLNLALSAYTPELFISKKDKFSIQPPSFILKPKITKENQNDGVSVRMHDIYGNLFRIECYKVSSEICKQLECIPMDVLLTALFENGVFHEIQRAIPDAKIIKKDIVELDGKKVGYLCLCDFPNGSILVDAETQTKRKNSMRGHLLFIEDSTLVILGYQTDMTFLDPSVIPYDVEQVYTRYRENLLESANSFKHLAEPKKQSRREKRLLHLSPRERMLKKQSNNELTNSYH